MAFLFWSSNSPHSIIIKIGWRVDIQYNEVYWGWEFKHNRLDGRSKEQDIFIPRQYGKQRN
jgi:hypothetical protein